MSRFRPGTLTSGDAAALNDLAARVDALSRMSVAAPLSMTKSAGAPLITMTPFETILAEITEDDGGDPPVYKAKRKTREGLDPALLNAVVDYRPETVFEQVLNPLAGGTIPSDAEVWAAGTLVQLVPIPDWRGWYWGYKDAEESPAFYARLTATDGTAWKWQTMYPLAGSWAFGPESDDYTAVQIPQSDYPETWPTVTTFDTAPTVGMRVLMQRFANPASEYTYGFTTPLPRAGMGSCGATRQLSLGLPDHPTACVVATVDLPGAGTYLVTAHVSGYVRVYSWYTAPFVNTAFLAASIGGGYMGEFYVASSSILGGIGADVTDGSTGYGSGFSNAVVTVAGPTTLQLTARIGNNSDGYSSPADSAFVQNATLTYLTLSSAEAESNCPDDCTGSGTGESPGGCGETTITATAAGTASGTDAGTSASATISAVEVPACCTLIVTVGMWSDGGSPATDGPTFAGVAMAFLGVSANPGGGAAGGLFTFYTRPTSTITGDIVVSVTGGTTNTVALLTASYVTALTPDLDQSADDGGSGTVADSGVTGTTTVADEYATAAVLYGNTNAGTWGGSFSEVQAVSAGGVTLREGYRILSATGTVQPTYTKDGSVPWACLVGTIS